MIGSFARQKDTTAEWGAVEKLHSGRYPSSLPKNALADKKTPALHKVRGAEGGGGERDKRCYEEKALFLTESYSQ